MGSFRFKEFLVGQDRSPMKVGTDGVLLGAWCRLRTEDLRLLDIGTGTGLIALMMAQRAPQAHITALDIDPLCAAEARANADASPWGERIEVVQMPVQSYRPNRRFDLILSNPPFFSDALRSPDAGRTRARHTDTLPFAELLDALDRLLTLEGHFAVVLPPEEARRFLHLASGIFWLVARTDVQTTPRSGIRRVLLEFSRRRPDAPPEPCLLTIQTAPGAYTEEYRRLTKDFYLKF